MITRLNSSASVIQSNSAYNAGMLDISLSRKNFINAISAESLSPTNFNTFIELIYSNNLQDKLNFWFSAEYTKRSGTIVNNLQDTDRIYFYSRNKDYSGQYLSYLLNKSKFDGNDNSISFTTTESLYYHLTIDKTLPLNNSSKTILIVMSPINSVYEYDNTEDNWFFNYGLEWSSSLQPTNEGLCFTYQQNSSLGKILSYNIGGNSNYLITDNSDIQTKGVLEISYSNENKRIYRSFKNTQTINMLQDLDVNYPLNIKAGNGFFLNSQIINNSVNLVTYAQNKMKNWKIHEFMIFDTYLSSLSRQNMISYLMTKYEISS